MKKILHNLYELLITEVREIIRVETAAQTERLMEAMRLKIEDDDDREIRERKRLAALPPITNQLAASLIYRTTRHLQRKRSEWGLKWVEDGNEVRYEVLPLMDAIKKHRMAFNPKVFDEITRTAITFPNI